MFTACRRPWDAFTGKSPADHRVNLLFPNRSDIGLEAALRIPCVMNGACRPVRPIFLRHGYASQSAGCLRHVPCLLNIEAASAASIDVKWLGFDEQGRCGFEFLIGRTPTSRAPNHPVEVAVDPLIINHDDIAQRTRCRLAYSGSFLLSWLHHLQFTGFDVSSWP